MEYLIGFIVFLLGSAFYYKNKSDKNSVEASLSNTKGRDKELQDQQAEVEEAIRQLDLGIQEMKKQKNTDNQKRKHMTLKQRADEAKNRYKK